MGKRKSGPRTKSGRLSRAGQFHTVEPAGHILARRKLFSFVQLPLDERQDGRNGEIDSEVSDGIGQLCACGLLDGHGHEARVLRDHGRIYGELYWGRYRDTAPKTSKGERVSKSTSAYLGETGADRLFDKLDEALCGEFERGAVHSLVVDPFWGDEIVPWAHSLICEELLRRGRIPEAMIFPTLADRAILQALVRGLCQLVDCALPSRRKIAA